MNPFRNPLTPSLAAIAISAMSLGAQPPAVRISRPIAYYNPEWSPDGRTIVFESTLNGPSAIFTIGADGKGLRQITRDSAAYIQPGWSPDGSRIVFSSDGDGHSELYTMNADGSGVTRLAATSGGLYSASFSPDGKWIVYQGRSDKSLTRDRVWVIAAGGGVSRQLSDSAHGAEGPRWSPDGRTISFLQVPYPKNRWPDMNEADMQQAREGTRRVSIRPDGTGLTVVTNVRKGDSGPQWTPDGRKAFSFLRGRARLPFMRCAPAARPPGGSSAAR
jgi:Tol biopolymer transport system component